ncbi:MAG: ComEC/Rec2 family competence protein [Bacteroidetes bacterium]|nr:ComEC/Rec2 family competence protein [Bacteroidota bacterium]
MRILIPLILGITTSLFFINTLYFSGTVFIFQLLVVAVLYCVQLKIYKLRFAFLIASDAFLFMFGINLTYNAISINNPKSFENISSKNSADVLVVQASDIPVKYQKFTKIAVNILALRHNDSLINCVGKSIVYYKNDLKHNVIKPGSIFAIKTKLTEINPPLNPHEFDYKSYLQYKNINYTLFADSTNFKIIDTIHKLPILIQFGLDIKSSIISNLKNSNLTNDAFSICAALITGYDDEIDRNTMQAFSYSGTLHVLSVSGLHTGLIYLILSFLWNLFDKNKRFKTEKFIIISSLLWIFALITGFSSPVLRAVIMFNLVGFGAIFFRNSAKNQINILLVSAFIILLYNPLFIADIGFSLSYFAMLGLFSIQPIIKNWVSSNNKFVTLVWENMSAGVAATFTTLPITLFYFHQFPLWFLISNLIIVPLTFILLIVAFMYLFFKLKIIALILNTLIKFLLSFVYLFNSQSAIIDYIHFDKIDLLFLILILILIFVFYYFRRYKHALATLLTVIVWQCYSIAVSYSIQKNKFVCLYQVPKINAVAVKDVKKCVLNNFDSSFFLRNIKPHFIAEQCKKFTIKEYNYIVFEKHLILLTPKKIYATMSINDSATILFVRNNYKITSKHISEFKQLKKVVVDGSNTWYNASKIENICRKFKLEFYNTAKNGAFILNN